MYVTCMLYYCDKAPITLILEQLPCQHTGYIYTGAVTRTMALLPIHSDLVNWMMISFL